DDNETKEQIIATKVAYNEAVLGYNKKIQTIPSNLVAMAIGYKRKKLLKL
nr:LemA family protein [Sulfurimonas sp.]